MGTRKGFPHPPKTVADSGGAGLPHAGRVGAACRDLAGVAARARRLAGQAGADPLGLRRGGAPPGARRARAHPGQGRDHGTQGARGAGARGRRPRADRLFPRADRSQLDARLLPAVREIERRRRRRDHQLEIQRLGQIPQPQEGRRGQRLARKAAAPQVVDTVAGRGAAPAAHRARGWQHRRQRSRHAAHHRGVSVEPDPGAQSGRGARGSRARDRRAPGRTQGAVAQQRHRGRRHPRPRRRPGALRRRTHGGAGRGDRPRRRELRQPGREPHAARVDDQRRRRAPTHRRLADAGAAAPRRRPVAGELRELLHRQPRRAGADVQRPPRPPRAADPGGAVSRPPRRRHPRRGSGLGPRHPPLHDAAKSPHRQPP